MPLLEMNQKQLEDRSSENSVEFESGDKECRKLKRFWVQARANELEDWSQGGLMVWERGCHASPYKQEKRA